MIVTKDQYDAWRDNEVTRRFLDDIAANLEDSKGERIMGSAESILKQVAAREEAMTIYENVLEWQPHEITAEDDSNE